MRRHWAAIGAFESAPNPNLALIDETLILLTSERVNHTNSSYNTLLKAR